MDWAREYKLPTNGRRRRRLHWVEGINLVATNALPEPPTRQMLAITFVPVEHEDLGLVQLLETLASVILADLHVFFDKQLRRKHMFFAIGDGTHQAQCRTFVN